MHGGSDDGLSRSPTRSAARVISTARDIRSESKELPLRAGSAPSMFRCMPINHRKVLPDAPPEQLLAAGVMAVRLPSRRLQP